MAARARQAAAEADAAMKTLGCGLGAAAGATATKVGIGFAATVAWPVTLGVASAVGTGVAVYGVCKFAMSLLD